MDGKSVNFEGPVIIGPLILIFNNFHQLEVIY